jgi:hypothetical protein
MCTFKSSNNQEVQSELNSSSGSLQLDEDVRVRKYGEVLLNTISSVASVLEYPKGEYEYTKMSVWSKRAKF